MIVLVSADSACRSRKETRYAPVKTEGDSMKA